MNEPVGEGAFRVGLGGATAAGLLLSGAALVREPLWVDELASLALVSRPFGSLVGEFPHEHNGTLFHAALWPIVELGGTSAGWLRLPALLAFAVAVPILGLLGARLAGRAAGLASAWFLALNPFAVAFAQEARMYGFALAFAVVAAWMLLRALDSPTLGRFAAYALSVAALGYSHDLALLAVLAHPVLVLGQADRATRRRFMVALATAGLLLVPLAAMLATEWGLDPLAWVTRPGPGRPWGVARLMTGSSAGALACLAVVLAGGLAMIRQRRLGAAWPFARTLPVFLAVWLLAPFVLLFLVSQAKPVLVDRYLLPSVAALCLLLASAVVVLGRRVAPLAALLVAAAFLAASVRDDVRVTKGDWPAAARLLSDRRQSDEEVAAFGDSVVTANALLYYGLEPGFDRGHLLWSEDDLDRLPRGLRLIEDSRSLTGLAQVQPSGIWLVGWNASAEETARVDRLAAGCERDERTPVGAIVVRHLTGCRLGGSG